MWRPSIAQACPKASTLKAKESSDIEDLSSGSSNEDGSPSPRYSLRFPPPSQCYLVRSEDEVEDDVITISGKQLICTSKLMIQVYPLHFRWRSNRGNQRCHSGHSSLCQWHQGYLQFFDEFWWYGKPLDFFKVDLPCLLHRYFIPTERWTYLNNHFTHDDRIPTMLYSLFPKYIIVASIFRDINKSSLVFPTIIA